MKSVKLISDKWLIIQICVLMVSTPNYGPRRRGNSLEYLWGGVVQPPCLTKLGRGPIIRRETTLLSQRLAMQLEVCICKFIIIYFLLAIIIVSSVFLLLEKNIFSSCSMTENLLFLFYISRSFQLNI